MKVLNLLSAGGIGGIETLCKDIAQYSDLKNDFCFLFAKGPIFQEMENNGANVIDLSEVGGNISVKKWCSLYRITKGYDVVVAHHGSFSMRFYFALLANVRRFRRQKYVLVMHSCFEKSIYYSKNPLKNLMIRCAHTCAMEVADRLIFVSEAGRHSFIKNFNINISKSAVVYNGISEKLIDSGKNNVPAFEGILNILYIGRLEYEKGVHLLINAIYQLKAQIPIKLTIVGDGASRAELELSVRRYDLGAEIFFAGIQLDKEKFLKQANVFVYPSICQEVFGLSIVEAMAYGIPCVSNNVGGVSEIICDGVNGFLTSEKTAEELAENLMKIFASYLDGDIKNIQLQAKKTANRFSILHTVNALKKEYEGLFISDQ